MNYQPVFSNDELIFFFKTEKSVLEVGKAGGEVRATQLLDKFQILPWEVQASVSTANQMVHNKTTDASIFQAAAPQHCEISSC